MAMTLGNVTGRFWRWMAAGGCGLVAGLATEAAENSGSKAKGTQLQIVATFEESMPTGVTVSQDNRVFVNFPRWGDPVPYTVAEIKNGKAAPFPDADINRLDTNRAAETFVSVQSVVVDPRNRLWVLDTGSVKMEPVVPNGPKLVCIDLASNKVVKKVPFPREVALPTTYLNDIRFDLRNGEGVAYITDSSEKGPNGIIVVDLGSGKSRRVLHEHPSTKAEPNFVPTIDGKKVMKHEPGKEPQPIKTGSDGIAISADGSRLYYCPLGSRKLYSVPTGLLLDASATPEKVGRGGERRGGKGRVGRAGIGQREPDLRDRLRKQRGASADEGGQL